MAISVGSYAKNFHEATHAQGAKAVTSDFTLVIDGYESHYLLTKGFPLPKLSTGEAIEVPSVLGTSYAQPSQVKFYQSGGITLYETEAGSTDQLLVNLIAGGGTFNAWVFHGTPENFIRKHRISNCFMEVENPDASWEDRTKLLEMTGTIHFHYYGEQEAGGVKVLTGTAGGV